jgi:hypothetical protein
VVSEHFSVEMTGKEKGKGGEKEKKQALVDLNLADLVRDFTPSCQ